MLNSKYRSDIDGLRAVAILAVVLFHAFPEIFKGGFIGVDIFFVISGYLISNILFEELKEKNFSFISFYFRRIKRIFPSLIAVLIFIYALGWFVLYPPEYAELGKHMMAGGAFFANFSFWQEAGYFDQKTTLKPLLHLWSLSVEEQFYIIWPCLLFLMWRIRKISLWLIIIFLGISFATNLYLTLHAPQAAFYLPFGRFWELIVGAGLAYTTQFMPEKFKFFDRHSQIIGLVAILILGFGFFVIDQDRFFPGAWAIIPTLGATLLILSGQHSYVGQKILSHPMLVKIGLISYPLYLWHWPLFSFAFILFGFEIPSTIKILIIFVSILLAWLCYILLEKPIRKQGYKTSISLLVIMIFVVISGHSVYVRDGLEFRIKKILDVYGGRPPANDPDCLVKFSNYGPIFCRLSDPVKPTKTVILGDSVAHNTYPGIANRFELTPESLVMMGWPGVAPFLKIITAGKEADPNTVKMNRLIQGEVGSGKTLVAVRAMLTAVAAVAGSFADLSHRRLRHR